MVQDIYQESVQIYEGLNTEFQRLMGRLSSHAKVPFAYYQGLTSRIQDAAPLLCVLEHRQEVRAIARRLYISRRIDYPDEELSQADIDREKSRFPLKSLSEIVS